MNWDWIPGYVVLVAIAYVVARRAALEILAQKAAERAAAASERQRLADDADYQQWHALWGEQAVAIHGRFQP